VLCAFFLAVFYFLKGFAFLEPNNLLFGLTPLIGFLTQNRPPDGFAIFLIYRQAKSVPPFANGGAGLRPTNPPTF